MTEKIAATGKIIATAASLITTNWGLVFATVSSAVASIWVVVNDPNNLNVFFKALLVFDGVFIIVAGSVLLFQISKQSKALYDYGLTFEGLTLGHDLSNETHAIQIGLALRNFCPAPLRYKVERFDVIIGNRTIAKRIYSSEGGFMPRGAGRVYRYPAFQKDLIAEFIGKSVEGTIEFAIAYGPPDKPPIRRLVMKLDVNLILRPPSQFAIVDSIVSESDEKI